MTDPFKEEDILEIDLPLPCGHTASKGQRKGLWIEDEILGSCPYCGATYNMKIVASLVMNGEFKVSDKAYIAYKRILEKDKANFDK
jgi:hypothetical protein